MLFDENQELIGWFDAESQSEANGIPEGPLNEFMFKVEGPFVITERIYARSGGVKAVIIRNFGEAGVNYAPGVPLEYLRGLALDFGLIFIWRPREGRSLDAGGGRYFSEGHSAACEVKGSQTVLA